MASLIKKIIKKISQPKQKRCPACHRTLYDAINEQVVLGQSCPLEHCAFKNEIKQAILESKTPEVILWSIDKNEIFENETATLSWEVLYAKKVSISNIGEVALNGTRSVSPRRNTKYTLTIQDWSDNIFETEDAITINVTPLPIINFKSDKKQVEVGDAVTFNWTVEYVSKVELFYGNSIIDVSNKTDYLIHPHEGTTFKLIATGLDNKTTVDKEIRIEVFPKPIIKFFKVSPEVVISSQPVTISWKVENAKTVKINNGINEVNEEGKITVLHKENTLYQLTVIGELSSITKDVVVKVFPTPIIESLKVPMPDFSSRININPTLINPPQIDISINIPEFNLNPPQIMEPEIDLKTISPIYKSKKNKNKLSIFNFSKLYEYFTK